MSKEEISSLLDFFNPNMLTDPEIIQLKSLPLFETVNGTFEIIHQNSCLISTSNIPQIQFNLSILKEKSSLYSLYKKLNIKMLRQDSEIYENLILPQFFKFNKTEKIVRIFVI